METVTAHKHGAAPAEGPVVPTMTMGDIVRLYPQAIPVIQSAGLHCVGCGVAYWETLEDGCLAHGMTADDVSELLLRINKAIKDSPADSSKPISVTDAAVGKLKQMLAEEGKAGWGLRVMVVPGGCAGNSYEMDFEKEPKAGDTVVEEGGIKFMVDSQSLPKVSGARIDYSGGLKGSGFSIRNPNAQSTCGCGSSFS